MADFQMQGLSPEEVAQRRRYGQAAYQAGSDASPVGHWTQALARVVQGANAGAWNFQAQQGETDYRGGLVNALRASANGGDIGTMGRSLISSGYPELANQGLGLLTHDATKKADLQSQLDIQKQKFEFERKLALDLKKQENEDMIRQLRAIGVLGPEASSTAAPSGVPGTSLSAPPVPQPPGQPPVAPPQAVAPQAPVNPNARFADNLLPPNQHVSPSAQQKAGVALILKQPGKAVDALNESKEKLTEGQVKDASFAERIIRSEVGLREVVPTDEKGNFLKYDPTKGVYRFLPDWNITNSAEWQQYKRNAREGIAAILRKDTGAAVSDTEWEWYFPMYYPQPGDSGQVVKDKEEARAAMARGLRNGSGPAFDQMFPKFNEQFRERLLRAGADLTPKPDTPKPPPGAQAPEAPGAQYAQIKRNPKTGEMVGFNPQTNQWEPIATNQAAAQGGNFKSSYANRGTSIAAFPEPKDM